MTRISKKLRQAGATEVVPEAIAASLMLAGHALAWWGVAARDPRRAGAARAALFPAAWLLHGADDSGAEELEQERLVTVTLPTAGRMLGCTLGDMCCCRSSACAS